MDGVSNTNYNIHHLCTYVSILVLINSMLCVNLSTFSVFRHEIVKCVTDGSVIYHDRDNVEFLRTVFYSVSFVNSFMINFI